MHIFGLDFRLNDVSEIKGISNCLINFDFGSFESCSYNCTNLTGGLFAVSVLPDDINSLEIMNGDLTVTVISPKRNFEVLCDGFSKVNLSSEMNPVRSFFPINFVVLGTNVVNLNMFYRNKGPTRIKAGTIEITISVIDLSKLSNDLIKPSVHCKLYDKLYDKSELHEDDTKEAATNTSSVNPINVSVLNSTSHNSVEYGEYSESVSDDESDYVDDDSSIEAFMSRFKMDVTTETVLPTTTSRNNNNTANKASTTSTNTKKKSTKAKPSKYWYTSLKIEDTPAVPARTRSSNSQRPVTAPPRPPAPSKTTTFPDNSKKQIGGALSSQVLPSRTTSAPMNRTLSAGPHRR